MMPQNNTQNATTNVTIAATGMFPLTAVPMTMSRLAAAARAMYATSFSRRDPPKLASTSVANPPNET